MVPVGDGSSERWKLSAVRAMEGLSDPERASVMALVNALTTRPKAVA